MVHAIADPPPRWGERQGQSRIFVATQSAVYGHHPIPEKIAGLLPDVCGNGIAPYSSRQGHWMPEISRMLEAVKSLPIFVEQIAITQVGDASATQFTQTSEWGRVRA
jgi:hypothetical protein